MVQISRRDRTAYRVPESSPHLVPLADGWALWRWVGLRGAGFPVDLLERLADPVLSRAADRVPAARSAGDAAEAAFQVEFDRATQRLSHALRDIATRPAFREAIAWQNRHALATGVDVLLRHEPGRRRTSRHRDRESLVARYLQRYCAKNDTIGFFGPVGWAALDDGPGVRVEPAAVPLLARTVFLEGWAVAAVLAPYTAALRPWLVPRRMPFIWLDGTAGRDDTAGRDGTAGRGPVLRVPLAPPQPLTPAAAAVLAACDGVRDAAAIADALLAEAVAGLGTRQQVYGVLAELADRRRLVWRVEAAPHDIRPEVTLGATLARVTDPAVRAPAQAALDELTAARDALAAAAGDDNRVATAMAALEATFTPLTGAAPTRRAGELYAGRTLAYEECLRAATVHIGASRLDGVRAALGLVLDTARWFTGATATLIRRAFVDAYHRRVAELGTAAVPFADVWLPAVEVVFEPPPQLEDHLVRALQRRWAEVLDLPAGTHRAHYTAAELRPRVRAAFPAGPPGWPTAVHHSPDLMLADGPEPLWVLGELHPGLNTLRYATMVAHHPAPDELHAAMTADLRRGMVIPAETREAGGIPARMSNALTRPVDRRLVYAPDGFGHGAARTIAVGDCDLVDSPAGLRVRRRDGSLDVDLMEALGDLVSATYVQNFRMLAPARHTPRVTIDALVVSRESWTFTPAEIGFAAPVADEARRFVLARAWAAEHGLPRHVFVRCTGETKPMYADLTSLASVELLTKAVRQARRLGGDGARVTVVEMLPTPDQLWLHDAAGHRYAAELRVVAVDRERG